VYAASYFLPVKPVDSEILLTEAQFKAHQSDIERPDEPARCRW
jgi:hypothetical protein